MSRTPRFIARLARAAALAAQPVLPVQAATPDKIVTASERGS
jgi:hypothetical protein